MTSCQASKRTRRVWLGLGCVFALLAAHCGGAEEDESSVCHSETTCGSCTAVSAACSWCMGEFHSLKHPRCDSLDRLVAHGCPETAVLQPKSHVDMIRNLEPDDGGSGKETVQLAPQAVKVTLRPNTPFAMEVRFRQAKNYPVDLYVVMDLSKSMGVHKNNLESLTDTLAEVLANITSNYRFGFGSFIDKTTAPFINTLLEKLAHPCLNCAPTYGFRNDLPLTKSKDTFKRKVGDARLSGNLDTPEGGFDGIMQAVVCTDAIGWGTASRKILMYVSDEAFHQAMDGKLAGIIKPNDGHCHLDGHGYYNQTAAQDYPSISQLSRIISEKKINVIFAVTKDMVELHGDLSNVIEGSSVGELSEDKKSVVNLVQANYNKISSTVELKATPPEGVFVKFQTSCMGSDQVDNARCSDIKIGEEVTFTMTIQVNECPTDRKEWEKYFRVSLVGLEETLDVNISLACECPCEKDDFSGAEGVAPPMHNSSRCEHSGTYNCGACTCDPGYHGPSCACSGSGEEQDLDSNLCRSTNDSQQCEGRGQCNCGSCSCFPILPSEPGKTYSGTFCECNDYSCDSKGGELCGGPQQGRCRCGRCVCNPTYKGDNCECPLAAATCRSGDGTLCSGHGQCECGTCICQSPYTGSTCDDCPSCPGRCGPNQPCVQCKAFGTGTLAETDCNANCSHVTVVDQLKETPDRKFCKFRDEDGCDFFFTYEYQGSAVEAQRTKDCPEKVDVLKVTLGVIGGIVALGLLALILGKILVTVYDKKEFARFENERAKARWEKHDNPLYRAATSTVQNPGVM